MTREEESGVNRTRRESLAAYAAEMLKEGYLVPSSVGKFKEFEPKCEASAVIKASGASGVSSDADRRVRGVGGFILVLAGFLGVFLS